MFRGSTLAASEWPAEKREEVQERRLLPARWTLFELIRQREGREGTSQVVVSTHSPPPLSEMANRWRPPRSWYRRIIRFVTRYRITLAVYLSTRETPGLGKYWFERDGVYFRPSFRRYRFYGVEKKRISFNTRDKNILYQRQFNVHNLHRVLKVLIRMLYNFRTTSVS